MRCCFASKGLRLDGLHSQIDNVNTYKVGNEFRWCTVVNCTVPDTIGHLVYSDLSNLIDPLEKENHNYVLIFHGSRFVIRKSKRASVKNILIQFYHSVISFNLEIELKVFRSLV